MKLLMIVLMAFVSLSCFAEVVEVVTEESGFSIGAWITTYAGVIIAVMYLADKIAKLTPNKTDDAWVNTLRKLLRIVGLSFPDVDKAKAAKPPVDE
jgi:hypothetical protein